jgi:hypothetical protein
MRFQESSSLAAANAPGEQCNLDLHSSNISRERYEHISLRHTPDPSAHPPHYTSPSSAQNGFKVIDKDPLPPQNSDERKEIKRTNIPIDRDPCGTMASNECNLATANTLHASVLFSRRYTSQILIIISLNNMPNVTNRQVGTPRIISCCPSAINRV